MWATLLGAFVLFNVLYAIVSACTPYSKRKPDPKTNWRSVDLDAVFPAKTGLRYSVIGTGSVGKEIIKALLRRGETKVKTFDIVQCELPDGVEAVIGNITRLDDVRKAVKNVDVVFHTAAVIPFWQRLAFQEKFAMSINVGGADNVIRACQIENVPFLVQTSSSNVTLGHNTINLGEMSETTPYAQKPFFNHYISSKILAEENVLKANGLKLQNGKSLQTASLRLCSAVFGPGDKFVVEKALREKMYCFVTPWARIDSVYTVNGALAHLKLEEKLISNAPGVAGEVFAISNEEPMTLGELMSTLQAFYPYTIIKMPLNLMVFLAYISEWYTTITGKGLGELGWWTPASYTVAGASYVYNCEKARRVLGYKPAYTVDESLQKIVDEWQE